LIGYLNLAVSGNIIGNNIVMMEEFEQMKEIHLILEKRVVKLESIIVSYDA